MTHRYQHLDDDLAAKLIERAGLADIDRKVRAGERLSFDEGLFLDESVDVLTLGKLANVVRERKNGNFAFYNTNLHLNPTNVCIYRCRFCAFRADLRAERAYTFTDEMIRERVLEAKERGATEIHVVGGLHHQKKFDWYLNLIRILHEAFPRLHLKAWTAVEINWFQHLTGWTARDVWAYAKAHDIPLLPLYDLGYTSIGCEPCTSIPFDPANPRSGRWQGQKLECGIHIQAK